jgi:capsule biosynthesis phosphatase
LLPVPGAVEKIRELKDAGHRIIIYTARHMKTTGGNVGAAVARKGLVTLEWLERHGIPYDEIHFGKPHAHLYIDDNALRFTSWDDIDPNDLPLSHEELLEAEAAAAHLVPKDSVVILRMAGLGSRFQGSRFVDADGRPPKPLIDVGGEAMVWWALRSLVGVGVARLVFVILASHEDGGRLPGRLREVAASCFKNSARVPASVEVVVQHGPRRGQLLSVLEAREWIAENVPVLVAGADTFVASDLGRRIDACGPTCRGLISAANLPGDRWSFALTDSTGAVIDVAEKRRISDYASTGLYWFTSGGEFLRAADASIRSGQTVGGEHYVMAAYAELIKRGVRVEIAPAIEAWDMGTPEALETFLAHLRCTLLEKAGQRF